MYWNFLAFFAFMVVVANEKTLHKTRVLVTRFPYESRFGGEELHTLRLMEELDKRGIEAFFLGSCPVLLREFKDRGFLVKKAWLGKPPVTKLWLVIFTILSPILFLHAGILLGKARKLWRVDVLYALSFGEKLLMTPWAKLFGIKVVWLEHARIGNWMTKNPWRFVYKFLSRFATVVVTSNAMVKCVAPWVANGKVIAIPCGVILSTPEKLPHEILEFLKGGFAVGTAARLSADKGVDMLVHLVQSKPDVRLIIVGDGPLKMSIQKLVNPGQILLVPSLPRGQLMTLYQNLDLFVLASKEMDPFGMVAAEAMYYGAPVLMTNVCGISADLHDGREAFIVEPRISELDKTFKKIMKQSELRKSVAGQGQTFVQKHYRLESMVAAFQSLLTNR